MKLSMERVQSVPLSPAVALASGCLHGAPLHTVGSALQQVTIAKMIANFLQ
jgi:hypothetical protein